MRHIGLLCTNGITPDAHILRTITDIGREISVMDWTIHYHGPSFGLIRTLIDAIDDPRNRQVHHSTLEEMMSTGLDTYIMPYGDLTTLASAFTVLMKGAVVYMLNDDFNMSASLIRNLDIRQGKGFISPDIMGRIHLKTWAAIRNDLREDDDPQKIAAAR